MAQIKFSQEEIQNIAKGDIIDVIGLGHLDEEKKSNLRGKILTTVQNRTLKRIIDELKSKGKIEEFEQFPDGEPVEHFFDKYGIDYEKIFLEEALLYKTQLAMAAKAVDAAE